MNGVIAGGCRDNRVQKSALRNKDLRRVIPLSVEARKTLFRPRKTWFFADIDRFL
jgi:hypothetical protein